MGRHRHALNVRLDGLAPVLGRLLDDPRIRSAALVDVESGMVLDACGPDRGVDPLDLEVQSAGHADLVRVTLAVLHGATGGPPGPCEVVADDGAGRHHVVRVLPDGPGGPLALSVVVAGPERVVARVRRRLRRVSSAALTAGPSAVRRPPRTPGAARKPAEAGIRPLGPAGPDRGPAGPDLGLFGPDDGPAGLDDGLFDPHDGPVAAAGPSMIGRGPAPPSALPPSRRLA